MPWVYTPLISGEFIEVLQLGFFALFGIYATNAIIQWHAEGPIGPFSALLLVLGAVGAYWPLNLVANVAGAAAILAVVVMSVRRKPS